MNELATLENNTEKIMEG